MIILDGLGRMFSAILAGILIVMIPLRSALINYQNYTQNHLHEVTMKFTNDVMDKGYLTQEMYDKFYKTLNPSNGIYEIELIHSVQKEGQVDSNNFNQRNSLRKSEVLGSLMETCSNGHSYEIDFDNNKSNCQVCYETLSGFDIDIVDNVIEKGEDIKVFLTLVYLDGHTKVIEEGFSYDLDSSVLGSRQVTFLYEDIKGTENVTVIETYECNDCGELFSYGTDGDDHSFEDDESHIFPENNLCMTCNNKVVEISVDYDFYTLSLGENLEIEVTAIYPNDRSEKIQGWTSSFNPNKPGLQQVMIYYENVITSTQVFVESEDQKLCPNCNNIYSKIEYLQCPICSRTITGIETTLTEGAKVKLGSDLNLSVIYIYYDGSREIATEGHEIIEYDPNQLGSQNILIRIGEYEIIQLIEVVEHINTKVCSEGHYYLNKPIDPGATDFETNDLESVCPYCENSEIEKEITNTYTEISYTNEILNEIDTGGIYYFNQGDYFTVNVHVNNDGFFSNFLQIFLLSNEPNKYTYGGIIHDNFF